MTTLIATPETATDTLAVETLASEPIELAVADVTRRTTDVAPLAGSALSARWFARVAGMETGELRRRVEAGTLAALESVDTDETLYPVWQLDADARPLANLPRVLDEAARAGLDAYALHALMTRKVGLAGDRRLADLLRSGDVEHVLAIVRDAGRLQPTL